MKVSGRESVKTHRRHSANCVATATSIKVGKGAFTLALHLTESIESCLSPKCLSLSVLKWKISITTYNLLYVAISFSVLKGKISIHNYNLLRSNFFQCINECKNQRFTSWYCNFTRKHGFKAWMTWKTWLEGICRTRCYTW